MLTITSAFSQLSSFCNSNIKDHGSPITVTSIIMMKKFETLAELPKWDTETKQ